ncbi:MAG: HipA domain-containing protein [Deltaproteobacteria bacterium]|jgi:serine/threonine-protein kinase HipA|nr:HipA domain-containing protein [Deltaproteobacteria bacterium]MBT4089721.1 HipA domain-containing protein [Deltaproteobacteria bacterium]MBT4264343.1 HipA domain-containing protein [Deltaproteobacteria bacterium]MBT4642496.1 HipA domain-containing protein [Deltaproteobacteria bacterium]MBT6614726.1 HipA domain-containing protein [Deltaproteobacteria bacterium]
MNPCPSCLKEVRQKDSFCLKCSKELFGGNRKIKPLLSFDKQQYVSFKRDASGSFSISGVQDKISLSIHEDSLTPTKTGGLYILKPVPTLEVPLFQNDIPANEHLTMQLAKQVYKIKTASSCLVRFNDGEPAYLTKRFDISDDAKIAQEDFCQLLNMTEETHGQNYKYDSSYEQAASVVKTYCSASQIESEKYFFLLLFCYLFSNGDAHLKNFSLQQTPYNDYILAPAYDLISTSVHFPDEARTALDLFSNYESDSFRANGFYKKFDFLTLAEFMEVKENRASSFIDRFFAEYENALELVHRSFLSDEAKERFLVLFNDRLKAIES